MEAAKYTVVIQEAERLLLTRRQYKPATSTAEVKKIQFLRPQDKQSQIYHVDKEKGINGQVSDSDGVAQPLVIEICSARSNYWYRVRLRAKQLRVFIE